MFQSDQSFQNWAYTQYTQGICLVRDMRLS